MHTKQEAEYISTFRTKRLRELLWQWAELNHLNQEAISAFLLHPNPPFKQHDINFLKHLTKRIEIIKEIIEEKKHHGQR